MLWTVTKGFGVVFPLTDRKTSKPKNYIIICPPIPCICSLYNVEMSIYLSIYLAIYLSFHLSYLLQMLISFPKDYWESPGILR